MTLRTSRRKTISLGMAVWPFVTARLFAGSPTEAQLDQRFRETVQPFVQTYCVACHSQEKHKGELDLTSYSNIEAIASDFRRWDIVVEKLKANEMPPEEAKRQPPEEVRREIIAWIQAMRADALHRNAGDPGPVPARRLSNAEYNYTIRDLTGADIQPAREFPVDPANQAGFDNSGESLAMSPALVKKYLAAARLVSEHMVLKAEGFAFAPHPAVTDTDRDKYAVKRIIQFYQRQPTDYADYFLAAWRFQNRAALGQPKAVLADFAAASKISPKYLATVWSLLTEAPETIGPIAALQDLWRELPRLPVEPVPVAADVSRRKLPTKPGSAPTNVPHPAKPQGKSRFADEPASARRGCEQMRDFVVHLRQKVKPEFPNLKVPGMHEGSQSLVLWKDRQYATHRRQYPGGALQIKLTDPAPETPAGRAMAVPETEPERERYEAAFKQFCAVFPDAFYVSERARIYLDEEKEKSKVAGRLLSAGFHSQMGYFRDDAPLYELILDPRAQQELDMLWRELDFITFAPMRQHRNFLWFERTDSRFMLGPDFEFARAEDKDSTSEAKIKQLAEVYLAKARRATTDQLALSVVEEHFKTVSANIRAVERDRLAAEPSHLAALQDLAGRAFRRPLSRSERDDLIAFYHTLREESGLDHEEAVRDTVVSILMSPHFCYRLDLEQAGQETRGPRERLGANRSPAAPHEPGNTRAHPYAPLSDYALASRLSYFLWSSMPDQELLDHAAAGDLHHPSILIAQSRRMLQDERVRALATEFGGNWLDFRRFQEHNAVDRERFPAFDNELRQAMFEEPIRFFDDVVRSNRSVLEFLYADYTFVNPPLAKHYGLANLEVGAGEWVRADGMGLYGRGGLLPMSVFLTMNAPGLRTSPVKRGYWVVRRLLGEVIPPPPPNVAVLPSDETKLGDLTLRETLARHREDKSCAACHAHFDAIGLAFEGYGPVGEMRDKDFGGHPVDTRAAFPGGGEGVGLEGLRAYLREHRQNDFVDNLCRKLLAYGLGRSLLLSDELTVEEMRARLAANGYRFNDLIESIVTTRQFLNQRASGGLAQR